MHNFKASHKRVLKQALPITDFESCVLGVPVEKLSAPRAKKPYATHQGAQMYPNVMVIGNQASPIAEISSLLEESGIGAITANNTTWRLEQLSEANPQVVIVETGSDPKGWEISSQIRHYSDIPIIMLGTTDSEMAWVKAAAYGVDCYLERPFSPLELVARIRALIRRYENSQENPANLQKPASTF